MITKDSDYLNNKLRQLKTSVLNKQQYETTEQPRQNPNVSSQKFISTIDQQSSQYNDPRVQPRVTFQVEPNLPTYKMGSPINQPAYRQVPYSNPQFNSPAQAMNQSDHKRPHSTQILDGFKQADHSFSNLRGQPQQNGSGAYLSDSRVGFNNMDPKVKTVHASNSRSFVNTEAPFDYIRSDVNYPPVNLAPDYTFRQPSTILRQSEVPLRTTNVLGSGFDRSYHQPVQSQVHYQPNSLTPDNDVLKTLNNQSFMEKHEGKIVQEMTQKLQLQFDHNNRLGEDIMSLRRALDNERKRLQQMDGQYREEFKHMKQSEADSVVALQNLDSRLYEIDQSSRIDDDRHSKMQTDLEKMQVENEMLRGELKRLGEITSEKILDLENNINSVARMKDFELENFNMEKEKVGNSAEFVIEQMKVHFNERTAKIEEHTRKIQLDKDKLATDLRTVTEELKVFNFNADQKINNTMNLVIQEESEKHQTEVKEIENKVRIEEDEIARINRRNQELLNKLQTMERDGKNRIMSRKNENTRLKEDLNNFEQNYNKLLIQVSNENREYEKKKDLIEMLKDDHEEVHNKSQMLDQRYDEEMHNIQAGHEDNLQDLESNYGVMREREQRLVQAIRDESDRLFDLQKRHGEIIEEIQRNFNVTLENQFGKERR